MAIAKPTGAALARHRELLGQLIQILGRLDAALTQDLAALKQDRGRRRHSAGDRGAGREEALNAS
jgi:hypothetical protein